jgi:hypothetical protein
MTYQKKSGCIRASWPHTAFMFQTVVAVSPTTGQTDTTRASDVRLRAVHRIDDREVRRIRVGSMDVSFIFAHLNTMLMFCTLVPSV